MRLNVRINWAVKVTVGATLSVIVRRLLVKYGYPEDLKARATETVLKTSRPLSCGLAGITWE